VNTMKTMNTVNHSKDEKKNKEINIKTLKYKY